MNYAYELIKEEEISDISSKGVLLKHKKSGANIALLINSDNNKVFNIAFRTPPNDSTGVAHIIEHTVLCGSKKFPLKDPFVELAKGSLNTFLNAMTYPDKTMYPIASCNDTDFKNLMEVYLDSVFYPNIYKTKKIFEQEGWHYHLENKEDALVYNGVVYNEMKGVYSSADSVLESIVLKNLFPDTTYGLESGGDPDYIPNLTYQQYLDFHKKYYHPSNSYIFLYGNLDFNERLNWLDKEYLSRFERTRIDSEIKFQAPFKKVKTVRGEYPVLDNEPIRRNTYLNMSVVTGDYSDIMTNTALNILMYVLIDAPGAPLKKALIDANVGEDVSGSFNDGILQPYFSIDVKYANASDIVKFKRIIRETLKKLSDDGIDKKALQAAINFYEFRFREADFSVYPKGLIYIMSSFDEWLYDENRPFDALKELTVFDELKRRVGTDYFENLMRERLMKNKHKVYTVLKPRRNLAALRDEKLAEKMREYKDSLSESELQSIIDGTKSLDEYQKQVDTPEVINKLPILSVSDINTKTPVKLCIDEFEISGVKILYHKCDTRGISYLSLMFDVDDIPTELVPYMGLLRSVLGYVNTKNYTYSQLSNEINAKTGGVESCISSFIDKFGAARKFFCIKAKYLDSESGFTLDIIREILLTSKVDNIKRLKEILISRKSYYQEYIPAAGHVSAVTRAMSGISEMNNFLELISGVSYYRFIEQLLKNIDSLESELKNNLLRLIRHIFRKGNLAVSLTASDEGLKRIKERLASFADSLYVNDEAFIPEKFNPYNVGDALMTAGQVQFVATAGNFKYLGYEYTGVMQVLKTMLNYNYLWKNLREKGGSYGCMSAFSRSGESYLVSYRDPHLQRTLKVYDELPEFLGKFDADKKTMSKLIIGTISALDVPLNARAEGELALRAYLGGLTEKDFQNEREEVLNASARDIRELSKLIKDIFNGEHICVIGSEAAIHKHEELFENIETFIQA